MERICHKLIVGITFQAVSQHIAHFHIASALVDRIRIPRIFHKKDFVGIFISRIQMARFIRHSSNSDHTLQDQAQKQSHRQEKFLHSHPPDDQHPVTERRKKKQTGAQQYIQNRQTAAVSITQRIDHIDPAVLHSVK